uniref:Uncharacterized protein n=1 Tax=Rhizophora mucronata TaxID=61149 RepID=A0A2P2NSY2_RHIMU
MDTIFKTRRAAIIIAQESPYTRILLL